MGQTGTENSNTQTRKSVRIVVSSDKLVAAISLASPEPHEAPVSIEDVTTALKAAGVVYGVDPAVVEEALVNPEYGTPVKVASGDPYKKGDDAKLEYLFQTVHEIKPTVDKDGRIDYRDLNFIRNIEKGAVLIRKVPATEGIPGKGVDGSVIAAPRGRDFPIKHGENTKVTEDGLELVATANGAIVFQNGQVTVKDLAVISGDVDFNVGNVECLGSARITGTVRPGFKVQAGGNVEIMGDVENGTIEAVGDVLVKGGCRGTEADSVITAGGDVIIKYAEGQKIISGGDVVVGGELINCQVSAKNNVWIKGRIGKIVGGEVRAGKQIKASVFGSDAGAATVLRVACDDGLLKKYHHAEKEVDRLEADRERVKESLVVLYRLQMDGKLDKVREVALSKLEDFQKSLPGAIEKFKKDKAEIAEKLKQFKDSSVVADKIMYPGVRVHFGIMYKDIDEEVRARKFMLAGNQIVLTELD